MTVAAPEKNVPVTLAAEDAEKNGFLGFITQFLKPDLNDLADRVEEVNHEKVGAFASLAKQMSKMLPVEWLGEMAQRLIKLDRTLMSMLGSEESQLIPVISQALREADKHLPGVVDNVIAHAEGLANQVKDKLPSDIGEQVHQITEQMQGHAEQARDWVKTVTSKTASQQAVGASL